MPAFSDAGFPDDDPSDEDEPDICSGCNGSGEGQYDGTSCSTCGGSGVIYPGNPDDDERPSYDYERD